MQHTETDIVLIGPQDTADNIVIRIEEDWVDQYVSFSTSLLEENSKNDKTCVCEWNTLLHNFQPCDYSYLFYLFLLQNQSDVRL